MNKLISKISLYIMCGVLIIIYAIILLVQKFFQDYSFLIRHITLGLTISNVIVILYCKFLWRFKWLNFSKTPNLNGKWNCKIIYDKGSKYEKGEKETELKIKQDLFDIQINMDTNEIRSFSVSASIVKEHGNVFLLYFYNTEPSKDFRETNPAKFGSAKLQIINDNQLEGEYWTNGQTVGKMLLEKNVSL